jgi:hypothetical protein
MNKNRFIANLWYLWQIFYSIPSFLKNSILWNCIKAFGLSSPNEAIGKIVSHWMGNGKIVGVCKDFHLWSLHHSIEPLFFLIPQRIFTVFFKALKAAMMNPLQSLRYE